ncbi:NAD(P)-dependent alcohol dehydrogenase [Parasphingorhabdus sp.]|uniref:NAD(P)-dependent alcohol dehydrogenase n=1 Tax=Parasphingorhabdus sp. TaxID=2709688 RepID=UPI003A8E87B7
MTVRAAILSEAGGTFVVEPVDLAEIEDDEVLVRVAGVGICHTDIAVRDRVIPVPLPVVLGHEASGIVEKTGSSVTDVSPGDKVVIGFMSCGECSACKETVPGYCESFAQLNFMGSRPDGSTAWTQNGESLGSHFFGQSSFATHAVANARNVVKVDSDLPLELLGPLGCGFMTGAGAVLKSLNLAAENSFAVFGAGPVGMAAIMAAKARGCAEIIAIDPLSERRETALEMGATAVCDPGAGNDVADAIRAIIPAGVDAALDTTGVPDVIAAAIASLAKRGTCALVAAPKAPGATVPVGFGAVAAGGLRIMGIMEGDADPQSFIPELLELQRTGNFPFERLIESYAFDDIEQAISEQAKGKCVKAVLVMDKA